MEVLSSYDYYQYFLRSVHPTVTEYYYYCDYDDDDYYDCDYYKLLLERVAHVKKNAKVEGT